MPGRQSYLISHGPRSGRGTGSRRVTLAAARLQARGHRVEVVENRDVAQARRTFARAVAEGVDVLVVAGGDGLVGLAAEICAGSQTALSLVPSGTGNDSARSLGIPLAVSGAVETLLAGRCRDVDLIEVQSGDGQRRTILGSVPMGIDARIAGRAARLPKWWGSGVYPAAVLPELLNLRPQPYRIRIEDGGAVEVEGLVVALCNLPHFGGGMRIAPHADPTDGQLDLVVISGVNPAQALGLLRAVFAGAHLEHPAVQVFTGSEISIEGPAHLAYGDGEPIGRLPVRCRAMPGALRVVV